MKGAGNYAASLKPLQMAKNAGYDEVLYLDAREDSFVEEVGAANFFAVLKSGVIVTPRQGSILPGITRDSVMRLIGEHFSWELQEARHRDPRSVESGRRVLQHGNGGSRDADRQHHVSRQPPRALRR